MPTWKKYAKADDAILKSLLTEQGDIIYASAASTPAALPHGTSSQYLKSGGDAANPSWDTPAGGAAEVKVKAETRNLASASGNVAYTGYGFTPTGLIIFAFGNAQGSVGGSNPAKASLCVYKTLTSPYIYFGAYIVYIYGVSNPSQTAIVASYDADGFTLTWTKTDGVALTANLTVFAFK